MTAPDWRPIVAGGSGADAYDAAYLSACRQRRPLVYIDAGDREVTAMVETVGPDVNSWRMTPEQEVALHRVADEVRRDTRQRRTSRIFGGDERVTVLGFGPAGRALLAERWAGILSCAAQDHAWTDDEDRRHREQWDQYAATLEPADAEN